VAHVADRDGRVGGDVDRRLFVVWDGIEHDRAILTNHDPIE
jgi:hypothetical protein